MNNNQRRLKLPIRKRENKYQVDFRKIGLGQKTYDSKSDVRCVDECVKVRRIVKHRVDLQLITT